MAAHWRTRSTKCRGVYGRTVGNATLLAGIRQDISPHSDTYAVIGVQGNVGTRLGWESYAFVSKEGDLTGEAQVIYQLPITSRLYLEPRVGLGWSAQAVAADAVRSGFTAGEGTLRLRYRLTKKANIYTALVHERLLGGTRRLVRDQGDAVQSTVVAIGFGFSL
ncbi:MAG: copper resistance protein B [Sphingobium sp.]